MNIAQFYQITRQHRNRTIFKLTASLLAFSFILTPFTPLFAQEAIPIPGETQNAYSNPDVPVSGQDINVPISQIQNNSTSTTKEITTTTVYPSKFYNEDSNGKTTKHIFSNGVEVGTLTGTGGDAVPRYVHTDQLTGSNIITNSSGTIDETLDYFPFGGIRIDSGSYSDQRKYIGQEYDADTGLSYLNARYYDGVRGQFTSQDPSFLDIGAYDFEQKYQRTLQEHLANPQSLNSYSYANNNPITYSDPEGKIAFIPLIGYILSVYGGIDFGIDLYDAHTVNVKYPEQFTRQEKIDTAKSLGVDIGTFGVGRFVEKGSRIAYDAITTTVEIISSKASDEKKKTGLENTKTNSPSTLRSPTSSQSKLQGNTNMYSTSSSRNNPSNFDLRKSLSDTINKTKQKINSLKIKK